jgi:hypothetical protein
MQSEGRWKECFKFRPSSSPSPFLQSRKICFDSSSFFHSHPLTFFEFNNLNGRLFCSLKKASEFQPMSVLCRTKGLQPIKIGLCIQEGIIWFMTVTYIQTQYVDLYITGRAHASAPICPFYDDAVRVRKETWTRRFVTKYILRNVTICYHFETLGSPFCGRRHCDNYSNLQTSAISRELNLCYNSENMVYNSNLLVETYDRQLIIQKNLNFI